jgi:hypothetical protein
MGTEVFIPGVIGSNLDLNNSSYKVSILQPLQFIFRCVRLVVKAPTSLAMFVRLSVCMQVSARFSMNRFPLNLIRELP